MRRQLVTGLLMTVALTVILGVAYPLAVTAVGQIAFHRQANGSMVADSQQRVVGSSLIGQAFVNADGRADVRYFQPRPSSAGTGYDAQSSSASNLGPGNADFIKLVGERVAEYRSLNGLAADVLVPSDAVTASGSGLDPHISVDNAHLQAARIAKVRGLTIETVNAKINRHIAARVLGFIGEPTVNVLLLNLDLDRG